MKAKVGLCFSRPLDQGCFVDHIGKKQPVYLRLFEFGCEEGWEMYVLSRLTYQGNNLFLGGWRYTDGQFIQTSEPLAIDLVYDRTGGVSFPPQGTTLKVINRAEFKRLCWDKWVAYQKIGKFMPRTEWVGERNNLESALAKIKTEPVVLKPFNGLKGLGIFIGSKEAAQEFEFDKKYDRYLIQDFVETEDGIAGLVDGRHDLRVVVVDGQAVWAHIRTPKKGELAANVAQGGAITEVDYDKVPDSIKAIVNEITEIFWHDYDNPIYSIDFGMGKNGPVVFEINDQMGFPLWEMSGRDRFLQALISNFSDKLKRP